MSRHVIVLGGGTAGLLAALALLRVGGLRVRMVRSREIGVIGVGEGTTASVPRHLHGYLGLDPGEFHREVRPSWKLGVRFLWGERERFDYTFTKPVTAVLPGLSGAAGYYCWEDFSDMDLNQALMGQGLAFARQGDGGPRVHDNVAYHLENGAFVSWLEKVAVARGLEIEEGEVEGVELGGEGVAALRMRGGPRMVADLFVDASGFRGELLREAMGERFLSFDDTLFCDRAVAGGWDRGEGEPVLPFTVAETMDSGWAWRIDHDERVHRGYVYSSAFTDDGEAEAELRRVAPSLGPVRVVKFRPGRLERCWVGNVFAVGNAAGFVEPLEATAIAAICDMTKMLSLALRQSGGLPGPELQASCNRLFARMWDEIRDFLSIHYRFNGRRDTPFWRECRERVALHGAERMVAFYRENGPTSLMEIELLPAETSGFQLEGYYTLLLGQKVPHAKIRKMPGNAAWQNHRRACRAAARGGLTAGEANAIIRSGRWSWRPGFYDQGG